MSALRQLNPLHWKHAHLIAWAIVSLSGGLLAAMLGYGARPSDRRKTKA